MSDPGSTMRHHGQDRDRLTVVGFDEISWLRANSPAWRLLRAENAPLVLSFLDQVFVAENIRSISAAELANRLDDELYALNERLGERAFPKPAKAYLDDWAAPEAGWLRKYYPEGSDEPHFDVTPAVEKALAWVRALQARSFVGTESRLNTVFLLLRQMAFGAETDPDERLGELRRRRQELDDEIARVQAGELDMLEASALRDRYQQFSATARELLADFREVEENFRKLDRNLREKIATWHGAKGELLDDVLGSRETIADSDQGRSFQAFYDFLLSQARQDELNRLLESVHQLTEISEADPRLRHIHYDWLDAAERTQATVRQLSEQLRRFLDDQVWSENRRVIDILHEIESHALRLREERIPVTTELDAASPDLVLPMERPLYAPVAKAAIDSSSIQPADEEADLAALFDQVYVDPAPLRRGVLRALLRGSQVGLAELVREHPLQHGLAELVAYLSLTDEGFRVVFDEQHTEQMRWRDPDGRERIVSIPRVTFARAAATTEVQR
jgi:flagellar motility protein MotE (MotC chaperone)